MFKNPFSFEGRIGRLEYLISNILFFIALGVLPLLFYEMDEKLGAILHLLIIVIGLYFLLAQGAKRCHDIDQSGFMQLIPFYSIYLIIAEGNKGPNNYGNDPKASISSNITQQVNKPGNTYNNLPDNTSTGYNQGSYYGGHNNTSTNVQSPTMSPREDIKSHQQESGYKGNLYN